MKTATVTIKNERGLHATPACMFAQTAMMYDSDITVELLGSSQPFNAKSLLHVVALGAKPGDVLRIEANGKDEHEAVAALIDLVENRNFDGE